MLTVSLINKKNVKNQFEDLVSSELVSNSFLNEVLSIMDEDELDFDELSGICLKWSNFNKLIYSSECKNSELANQISELLKINAKNFIDFAQNFFIFIQMSIYNLKAY